MISVGTRVRCKLTGATGEVVAITEPQIIKRLGLLGLDKFPRVYLIDIGRNGTIPREHESIEIDLAASQSPGFR